MIGGSKIRAQFPTLHQKVNGKDLIYFDNAASSQKPQVVLDAISNYYKNYNSNIHRGLHSLSVDATNKFEETRLKIKEHFGITHNHEIIFTSGTTGNPKGAELSYLALDSTKIVTEQVNPLKVNFSGNNDFISYLPLNHIVERVVVEHVCMRFGGSLSFVESIDSFAQNLKDIQPHVFFAAPRIWTKFQLGILAKVPQKKLDLLLKIPIISSLIKKKLKKNISL